MGPLADDDFARLWEVLDLAPVGIFETDNQGRRTYVNVRWTEMSGLRPDQASDGGWLAAVHPSDRDRVAKQWHQARATSSEFLCEFRFGDPARWVHFWARPLRTPDGSLNGFLGALTDIHERYELEQATRALLAALPVAVAVFDGDQVVLTNEAFARLSGWPVAEAPARPFFSLLTEASGGALKALLPGLKPHQATPVLHVELLHRAGHPVPVEAAVVLIPSGGHRRFAVVLRGRAELEAVERASRMSERLTSIATLAGGVAHEINNPLAFVVTNLAFVRDELKGLPPGAALEAADQAEALEALDEAAIGAGRIRKIVDALRSFARADDKTRGEAELKVVLQSALQVAKGQLPEGTVLEVVEGPLPLVHGPESQLAQVFVHVLVNAAEAVAKRPPGERRIRVESGTTPDGEARVSVLDSGPGIPAAIVDRVFDPFFTTKPIGAGAGLGLTLVHGVVSLLGGRVEIAPNEGKGAQVTLYLPAAPP